jgi:predicted phage-related endonuclease
VEQWHKDRSVRITASRFGDVLANPKTKRYRYYMEDILDSLNGHPQIEKYTPWFDQGKEREDEAISFYEWEVDRNVERFGVSNPKIFIHPKYSFIGCSPDLLDGDGGGEVKCHTSYKQYQESERKGILTQYIPQVQGQMWIMEKQWWNFISYYRNGDKRLIHIYCVYPDLEYFKRLENACLDFWNKIQRKLHGRRPQNPS